MSKLERIAEFCDQHYPPLPSRVIGDHVAVYGTVVHLPTGECRVEVEQVRTFAEARDYLGY